MFDAPNLARVFAHGAISGKSADARDVQDRAAVPFALVGVELGDLRLLIHVGAEIREEEVSVGLD